MATNPTDKLLATFERVVKLLKVLCWKLGSVNFIFGNIKPYGNVVHLFRVLCLSFRVLCPLYLFRFSGKDGSNQTSRAMSKHQADKGQELRKNNKLEQSVEACAKPKLL